MLNSWYLSSTTIPKIGSKASGSKGREGKRESDGYKEGKMIEKFNYNDFDLSWNLDGPVRVNK